MLCFAKTRIIDERGEICADYNDQLDLQGDRPSERFRMLLRGITMANVAYGVCRSSALRLTRLEQPYANSDTALLAELVLYGKFVEVPDTSFFRRRFEISTEKYPSPHDRMVIYEPGKADKLSFPYWWLFADFLAAICRAPISISERLYCFVHMHIWMHRWGRGLLQDLRVAAKRLMSWTSVKRVAVTSSGLKRD